jgi:hypothetical protein
MKKLLLLSALLMSAQSQAALVSVSGGGGSIIAGVSIQEDAPTTNDYQQGFNEKQGVTLASDIGVDAGVITAGTKVDSHIIFLNSDGVIEKDDTNTWEFSGNILGVQSKRNGNDFFSSNALFAEFSDYFTIGTTSPFKNVGLESNDIATGDGYTVAGSMLDLRMFVREPGDWIRVFTASAVPVPAAAFLFAPALLGFMGLRRKAKKSA